MQVLGAAWRNYLMQYRARLSTVFMSKKLIVIGERNKQLPVQFQLGSVDHSNISYYLECVVFNTSFQWASNSLFLIKASLLHSGHGQGFSRTSSVGFPCTLDVHGREPWFVLVFADWLLNVWRTHVFKILPIKQMEIRCADLQRVLVITLIWRRCSCLEFVCPQLQM